MSSCFPARFAARGVCCLDGSYSIVAVMLVRLDFLSQISGSVGTDIPLRIDSKTRIWAAYFCVIGLALGFFYIGLAWLYRKQEEPHAILLMVLTIPAFLFVSEGRKSDLEQYEREWDSFVAVIPTFALGVEFAMLLMGWILRLIHLQWLPNILVCLFLAAASVRQVYLWSKLLLAAPPRSKNAVKQNGKRRAVRP